MIEELLPNDIWNEMSRDAAAVVRAVLKAHMERIRQLERRLQELEAQLRRSSRNPSQRRRPIGENRE